MGFVFFNVFNRNLDECFDYVFLFYLIKLFVTFT